MVTNVAACVCVTAPAVPAAIGNINCPTQIINVPAGSDLSQTEYSTMGMTYCLSAGTYTLTSPVQFPNSASPSFVCYVGESSDSVTINLELRVMAYVLAWPKMGQGLQGLTIDGQLQAGAVSVSNSAQFATNQVVIKRCPIAAVNADDILLADSVVLASTTVTTSGGPTQPAVAMSAWAQAEWRNVSASCT